MQKESSRLRMEYSNAAAWSQQPQVIPEMQSVHDERSSATADDWKETASAAAQLNDLLELGDIQGAHNLNRRPPRAT